jgi:cytochrome c-type biogenesis protein CcmH/NrfG
VFALAALVTASCAWWGLRAYARAGGGARKAALGWCGAAAALALAIYLVVGSPERGDAPFAPRLASLVAAVESGRQMEMTSDETLALWAHYARQHPEHGTPHLESGKLLLSQGRYREAAYAFDQASRRAPEDPMPWFFQAIIATEEQRDAAPLWREALRRMDEDDPRREMVVQQIGQLEQ